MWDPVKDKGKHVWATLAVRRGVGPRESIESLVNSFLHIAFHPDASFLLAVIRKPNRTRGTCHEAGPVSEQMSDVARSSQSSDEDDDYDDDQPCDHIVHVIPCGSVDKCSTVTLDRRIARTGIHAVCGRVLAVGSGQHIQIFNMLTGTLLQHLEIPDGRVTDIAVSDQWLAAMSEGEQFDVPEEEIHPCSFFGAERAAERSPFLEEWAKKFFKPKQRFITMYIWAWREEKQHINTLPFGMFRDTNACVAMDGSTVFYSVGPERYVEACRAADGSSLWHCEILADDEPSTADRLDWLIVQGDILLAQHSNHWIPLCGVVMIETSTGALIRRVDCSTGASWDTCLGITARTIPSDDIQHGLGSVYQAESSSEGLQIWQPESCGHVRQRFGLLWPKGWKAVRRNNWLEGEPLRGVGEFSRVCVGKQWVAGICKSAKGCRDVKIFGCWCGSIETLSQHRLPYGRLCCLSAFAPKMVRIDTDVPVEPEGLAPQSFFVQVVSFVRALCSPRRKPLQGNQTSGSHKVFSKRETHPQAYDDEIGHFEDIHDASVVQPVDHEELAAVIDPAEANAVVHEQWATSRVEHALPPLAVQTAKDIVVLALTKHSKEVEDSLLACDLATLLKNDNFDIKPEWAGGAKVFVSEFGPGDAAEFRAFFGQHIGLGPHHVVIESCDEGAVLKALKPSAKNRALATVKPGGRHRLPLPHDFAWMTCSSASSSVADSYQKFEIEVESKTSSLCTEVEAILPDHLLFRIVVKRTFCHAEAFDSDAHLVRRSQSEPCMMNSDDSSTNPVWPR